MKNPATNSDSASGRSKGALLVSAIITTKNINESGNKGIIYQIEPCDKTIEVKFKEPEHKITVRIIKLITTS